LQANGVMFLFVIWTWLILDGLHGWWEFRQIRTAEAEGC
jgi:hypothetical protein